MTILLALYSHFSIVRDDVRLAAAAKAINEESEQFIGKTNTATPAKPAATVKPATVVKPAVKPAEVVKPVVNAEEPAEEVDECLIEVYPFYVCSVNNGKHEKRISINAPRKFKVFTTEEAKKATNNVYPTEDEFNLVIDEAWDMAMAGKPNKEIVVMLRKEIGKYYPELKGDSDWYGKLVNPLVASMNLIRTAFGYKGTDTTVQVARPYEADLVLTAENDLTVTKSVETKKAEPAKTAASLQTTQKGKVAERPGKDEEAQEAETTEESAEESTEEAAEEEATKPADVTEERDENKPPKVNKFDDFNALETLIFEKYREGASLAAGIKDEAGRKAVLAEKRDESRMLIASAFEDETWTEKVDGKWNPLLLSYHNDIVSQISANRAKWPK